MQLSTNNTYKNLLFKFSEDSFYTALKIITASLISFLLFYHTFGVTVTMGMVLGISFCSPSDVSSNLKDKIIGLSITATIIPLISIILTLLYNHTFIFLIAFSFFVFFGTLISLYGQRTNQISFSLLLGICLCFIHITDATDAISNGLSMFCGGIIYLIVSVTFYLIRPTEYINLRLAIYIDNIAQYLALRSELWGDNPDIETIKNKQLNLQVTINDSSQKVNQYLEINKNKIINSSNNRKIVLANAFLNEIMELALSSTFSDKEIEEKMTKEPDLKPSIKNITKELANKLKNISDSLRLHTKYEPSSNISVEFKKIQDEVKSIEGLTESNQLYLNHIVDYLDNQIKKVLGLERILTEKITIDDLKVDNADIAKYLKPSQYRFKTLIDNLNFKSTYFRYAFRLTIALLLGLIIGNMISLQKEYWVLLTIIVIMRPGYGLTKSRMNQRIIGTLIGGIAGIIIIFFVTNTTILAVLMVIAMLLGFWFTSSDYKIGVSFITLYIILMYGILKVGADIGVVYRISDTLIGALIALFASHYLWPSWETDSTKTFLRNSISSTKEYIIQFQNQYTQNISDVTQLQKARQDAFIAIGNLMASYQRLVQEPKNRQQNRAELYEIAVIDQTLVGAIASLGDFLRTHEDIEGFQMNSSLMNKAIDNLNSSLDFVNNSNAKNSTVDQTTPNDPSLTQPVQNQSDGTLNDQDSATMESKLINSQLDWIVNLSEQINKTAKTIQ